MALTLNLTLVVQMAHFFIAYLLIAKFFLSPGYEAVKSDDDRIRQLTALIVDEQEKLAEKQEYKRSRWQQCQNYFYQNRPELETEVFGVKSFKTIERAPALSPHDLEVKAGEISAALKKKVLHD